MNKRIEKNSDHIHITVLIKIKFLQSSGSHIGKKNSRLKAV